MSRIPHPRVFTRAELLVMIAVIVIGLGLFVPAVQTARETARRQQCQNNLKRLSLGVLNYESAFKALPYGSGGTDGGPNVHSSNKARRSGFIAFMPTIETSAAMHYPQAGNPLANPPIAPGGPAGWASYGPWNSSPSWMRCPSDPSGAFVGAFNSYRMSMGDVVGGNDTNPTQADIIWDFNNNTNVRGIFSSTGHSKLKDVDDGLAQTILLSERTISTAPFLEFGSTALAGQHNQRHAAILVPGIYTNPSQCYAHTDGLFYLASATVQGNSGKFWHDGNPYYTRFTTVLPPNAPSCFHQQWWGDGAPAIIPPTSEHVGGVNVAMVDGSVTFISERINSGNSTVGLIRGTNDNDRTGPSPYGTWGALGSKSGGESLTRPY